MHFARPSDKTVAFVSGEKSFDLTKLLSLVIEYILIVVII